MLGQYSERGPTKGAEAVCWVGTAREVQPGGLEAVCWVGTAREDQPGGSVLGDRQCGGNINTNTSFFFSFSFCLFFCVFFFFTLPWSIGYHHNH